MDELTPRQAQVLAWIREHLERTGLPPTRAELCAALGFRSPNAAESHLRALARKGAIELLPGRSRGIRLKTPPERPLSEPEGLPPPDPLSHGLPVVGRVAAGSPILAEEHVEARLPVDPGLFSPPAHYLLRVRGESMREAGILDGDLLAVHRTPEARDGQIVVARLEDEVTVKRLRREGPGSPVVWLLPENPAFRPIRVDLRRQTLVIEGLGVGVLRIGTPPWGLADTLP